MLAKFCKYAELQTPVHIGFTFKKNVVLLMLCNVYAIFSQYHNFAQYLSNAMQNFLSRASVSCNMH